MSIFKPTHTDYTLSPFTGLTRDSFLEAAKYLLKGFFSEIKDIDAAPVVKRTEFDITYPHKNAGPEQLDRERRAEIFEGLARSFFIAAPVIHEEPDLTVNGFSLRDYYKERVLRVASSGNPESAGSYEEMKKSAGNNPYACFQQTVETCALVICLNICEKEIWDEYTKEQQDVIAGFLSGYGHNMTVPQNWRLFNMLDLAFLAKHGYEIDEDIMREHALAIKNYYVGDGWYRDGQSFDYYSCWAFNVYTPIWCREYGYEHMPHIAEFFEKASNDLVKTFPFYFGRNGFVNMWGRSGIYRNAAVSPLAANFFFKNPAADPGLCRRVTAGALLQFLEREDFLAGGIPSLGFYGQFPPLVQGYSCAESPLWLGKAFLCLELPEDHPFWTATEKDNFEGLSGKDVRTTVLDGPALVFSNHASNGETILRTGKVLKSKKDIHGIFNYAKLCYNTDFPWDSAFIKEKGIIPMQYTVKDATMSEVSVGNAVFYAGVENDVLYRRQFFNYELETEMHWIDAMDLADFTVPYGVFRVDRMRIVRKPVTVTLASYGFPDVSADIKKLEKDGAKAFVLKGKDGHGRSISMAMTCFYGFDEMGSVTSGGTNPDRGDSVIVYGAGHRNKLYSAKEGHMMVSQVITRADGGEFTEEDIFPLKEMTYESAEDEALEIPTLIFRDGRKVRISFEGIESKLRL
ncbi:MAG: DUF2264 domain-containing protein [Lachnospiraceae bacterium]|nr:DUF2264 domain-containing protein [Lachnospiraceae bacterium]